MYLNSTPCTDGFNRQVHIRNKNSYVTNCIGLFKAFDFLRQSGGYDINKSVIAPTLPYKKCRGGRTQFGNFIQRLAGILIGKEDLNDHDTIDDDPAFLSAVGLSAASGCATLCNFENSLQRHTLTAMQQVLQDLFVHYAPKHPDILWVDVDCTPIYVYGNQENKEFSGHYGDYCLMAMVIFINNFPVYVTLDRGCQDGRAMLEEVYEEVIDFLREHYPDTPIVFRADSGFIRESLVRGIVEKGAYYLFGYAPNRAIQKFADTEWAPEVIKQYARPGDGMLVLRALGEYEEYRPKKWTADAHKNLRLILRDQYAPKPAITVRQKQEGDRPKEADLRCIITNIPTEDDGKCGQLWRATSAAIYEDLYCRRGSACELKFHELKDESRAQRASATRFLTNFYRLLLSAIAYTIFVAIRLKIFSRFEYKGRWWNVSVERMRRALLNIAGLVKLGQRKIEVEIQSALMDEPAFRHFWQYRIS